MSALRFAPLLGCLCVALAARGSAQQSAQLPADVQTKIISAVQTDRTKFGGKTRVPGAVVSVSIAGEGAFTSGFGFAALEPSRAMQSADAFRIGSSTGSFVSTLVLQEAGRGKLDLDATVASFDLGLKMPNANATVRQLLQMRSGLPDVFEMEELRDMGRNARFRLTPVECLHRLENAKALYPPGSAWNFSHTNYLLLGLIFEKVSGEPVGHAIAERILAPLKLTKTSYPSSPDLPLPYAHGYELASGKKTWEDVTLALPAALGASAGSMISTAGDMRRWVKAYVTGAGISERMRSERLACVPTGRNKLGFGLAIECSNGWYGVSGLIAGYSTAAWYSPKLDESIVVMVNAKTADQHALGVADEMARDVAKAAGAAEPPFPD